MEKDPNRQASIDSRRIALEREVNIRFSAFDTFVTEYSANVSTTGMFIVSDEPQPPGSDFNFEFSVADDWKLIRGRGQVVWARYDAEGPNRPAGMGIRFRELDSQSRRLIRWIVEKHIREGGKPFELEELREAVDEALEEALDQQPGEAAEGRRPSAPLPRHIRAVRSASTPAAPPVGRTPGRRRLPAGLLTVIGVGAIVAVLVWLSEVAPRLGEPEGEALQAATSTPAEAETAAAGDGDGPGTNLAAAAGAAATSPVGREQAAAAAPAVAASGQPTARAVAATVDAWSSAWSAQDADAYLDHYSRDFEPPDGQSLASWQSQRRERLRRPEFIRVAISRLDTQLPDEGRAIATFSQAYRSDTYADEVRKSLELVWEDGAWKIARERVVG